MPFWKRSRDKSPPPPPARGPLGENLSFKVIHKSGCNIRSEPTRDGEILGTTKLNEVYEVLPHWIQIQHGDTQEQWFALANGKGYCLHHAQYWRRVCPAEAQQNMMCKNTAGCSTYGSPNTTASVKGTVKTNDVVKGFRKPVKLVNVDGELEEWLMLTDGVRFVKYDPADWEATTAPTTIPEVKGKTHLYLVIHKSGTNIRDTPGRSGAITDTTKEHEVVEIGAVWESAMNGTTEEQWMPLCDGRGWALHHRDYWRRIDAQGNVSESCVNLKCTSPEGINIRQTASINGIKKGVLGKGEVVRVFKEPTVVKRPGKKDEKWWTLSDGQLYVIDGTGYWQVTTEAPTSSNPNEKQHHIVISDRGVELYASPSRDSKVKGHFKKNDVVVVQTDFIVVRHNDAEEQWMTLCDGKGYCVHHCNDLKRIDDGPTMHIKNIANNDINIRSSTNIRADKIKTVPKGAVIKVFANQTKVRLLDGSEETWWTWADGEHCVVDREKFWVRIDTNDSKTHHTYEVIHKAGTNIRAEPSRSGRVVGTTKFAEICDVKTRFTVTMNKNAEEQWMQLADGRGWVLHHNDYWKRIQKNDPLKTVQCVAPTGVNIRASANIKAVKTSVLNKDEILQVFEKPTTVVKVDKKEEIWWTFADGVHFAIDHFDYWAPTLDNPYQIVEPPPVNEEAPRQLYQVTHKMGCNIRSAPSRKGTIKGSLLQDEVVEVYSEFNVAKYESAHEEQWMLLCDGRGYVMHHAKFLKRCDDTNKIFLKCTAEHGVNIRSSANIAAEKLGVLNNNEVIEVFENMTTLHKLGKTEVWYCYSSGTAPDGSSAAGVQWVIQYPGYFQRVLSDGTPCPNPKAPTQCKKGHALELGLHNYPGGNGNCDICDASIAKESCCYRCAECEFDLCHICKPPLGMQRCVTCGYKLKIEPLPLHYGTSSSAGICNVCRGKIPATMTVGGKAERMVIARCSKCQFDCCRFCRPVSTHEDAMNGVGGS